MVNSYNIPLCDSLCPKSRYRSKIHVLSTIYLAKNLIELLLEIPKAYTVLRQLLAVFLTFYD